MAASNQKGEFMKIMTLCMAASLSFSSFASVSFKDKEINYESVNTVIQNEIGASETCLDEFLTREQQLRRFLIWAPPATVVAAPVAGLGGALIGSGLASAAGATGWAGLGYTIFGSLAGGVAVVGTFVGLETYKAIEFSNNRYMVNLVTAVRSQNYEHKTLKKFLKKYHKKYSDDQVSDERIIEMIEYLDRSESLCNGVVRETRSDKLKKKLARKRHLLKYLHNHL